MLCVNGFFFVNIYEKQVTLWYIQILKYYHIYENTKKKKNNNNNENKMKINLQLVKKSPYKILLFI